LINVIILPAANHESLAELFECCMISIFKQTMLCVCSRFVFYNFLVTSFNNKLLARFY